MTATSATSRHPGDLVRIGVGLAVLLVTLLAIQRDRLTRFEVNLFRLVNDLPEGFSWVLGPVMQLGNVVAAPALAVLALVALRRHRRATLDIVGAGLLAWFGAKLVKGLVERPRPGGLVEEINRIASAEGLGFVSGHTAVSTAIVAAASPYLPRRARRAVWLVPLTVGLGRIYYGAHLPLDIVGGAALGWAIAAAIHFGLGAPHRVPSLERAGHLLHSAGVPVEHLEPVPGVARGSLPFVAHIDGREQFVKLLDPEPRDRDWVYRAARFLAFRDVRDEAATADASTQAHREAAMTLLARNAGVRVPDIRSIESDGDRVWIVEARIEGTTLDRLSPEELTDDLLDALWGQVAALRRARIAHRDLVATNLLVDDAGDVWVVDFAHAMSSTRDRALDNDVAELLVTTGLSVGAPRAVAAARRVLGEEQLGASIPELQPYVLTVENRSRLRGAPHLLAALRTAAADAAGAGLATVPPLAADRRRSTSTVAAAVVVMAALVALGGPSDVLDVFRTPGFRWLGLALACTVAAPVTVAASLLAAIERRLALGRTAGDVLVAIQLRTLHGRAAGDLALVRRLARAGIAPAESRTAIRRSEWLHVGVSALAIAAFGAYAAETGTTSSPDRIAALTGLLVLAATAELLLGRRSRTRGDGDRNEPGPGHLVNRADTGMELVTGAGAVGLATLGTVAVVLGLGGGALVASIALVALIVGVVGRVGPAPGAPATAPVVLVLGLTVAGVPVAVAVSAAVVDQLLRLWLPVVAGAVVRTRPVIGR